MSSEIIPRPSATSRRRRRRRGNTSHETNAAVAVAAQHHGRHHNHPPRRIKRGPGQIKMARRLLLLSSCFIAVTSSQDDAITTESETLPSCREPVTATAEDDQPAPRRLVTNDKDNLNFITTNNNNNRPTPLLPQQQSTSPSDTPQLGDGVRCLEASGVFFDSLDKDGDGAIEPEEVAQFLQNEIGGKQFDTQSEVDEEVGTIMERLDQNHNNGLEMSDMLNYWIQLESLLSAEEVSEWIVYSVQLPSSVGRIFLENGITGYDFLEIVDNGGEILQSELGIDKASFRNKIVRQMQARMLGIGSAPGTPSKFTHRLESCKVVTLSWERSTARVFPVHSYRIQRRTINLFGGDSSSSSSSSLPLSSDVGGSNSSPASGSNSNIFDFSNSDWKTVYVGGENEFVDSGLETGHYYMYRIQAWNSVGKTGWESVDLTRALKKQRCSTKPPPSKILGMGGGGERGIPTTEDVENHWEWMSTPRRIMWGIVAIVQFVYHSIRFFFALIALLAGMMRFRRATATSSTTATTVLPFPWFWNGVNNISRKFLGQDCIPKTMLGDSEALARQHELHDEQVMATGLRGYDRLQRKKIESDRQRQKESGKRSASELPGLFDRRGVLKKEKSHSTGQLNISTVSFDLPSEISVPSSETKAPLNKDKFAWMKPLNKKRNGNISFGGTDTRRISESSESSSFSPSAVTSKSVTSKSVTSGISASRSTASRSTNAMSRRSSADEDNTCSECCKKFRIGKRYKHHCSRCMATFCHKHGKTTHNNFTSCKVPGDCMCNSCLTELSERSRDSWNGRRS